MGLKQLVIENWLLFGYWYLVIGNFNEEVPMERAFAGVIESEVPKDSVLISVGLPGSWKSPVTEEIARMKGFQILRSDMIRLEVLKGQDIFDNKVASSPENRRKVYEEWFGRAGESLRTSREGLILDATFVTQE